MLKIATISRIKSNLMRPKYSDLRFWSFSRNSSIQSPSKSLLALIILSLGLTKGFFLLNHILSLIPWRWRRIDKQCQQLARECPDSSAWESAALKTQMSPVQVRVWASKFLFNALFRVEIFLAVH